MKQLILVLALASQREPATPPVDPIQLVAGPMTLEQLKGPATSL